MRERLSNKTDKAPSDEAGDRLRMPPLIDHGDGQGARAWLRRVLSVLIVVVVVTGAGVAFWQVRDTDFLQISDRLSELWQQDAPSPDLDSISEPESSALYKDQSKTIETLTAALAEATHAKRVAEQSLAATQAALAEAQQNIGASPEPNEQDEQRAVLADLFIRLQEGAPFSGLLKEGALKNVLTPTQVAVLAVHAPVGVPSPARLRAQSAALLASLSGVAPSAPSPPSPMPAMLQWAHKYAGGLLTIEAVPPDTLGVGDDLQAIHQAILIGDFQTARLRVQTTIIRLDVDQTDDAVDPLRTKLHTLYTDLRTLHDIAPLMAILRTEFMEASGL